MIIKVYIKYILIELNTNHITPFPAISSAHFYSFLFDRQIRNMIIKVDIKYILIERNANHITYFPVTS